MASIKCPDCGYDIPDQARQCPECGHAVAMIASCPKCGSHQVSSITGAQKRLSQILCMLFPEDTKKCAYRCKTCGYKF